METLVKWHACFLAYEILPPSNSLNFLLQWFMVTMKFCHMDAISQWITLRQMVAFRVYSVALAATDYEFAKPFTDNPYDHLWLQH